MTSHALYFPLDTTPLDSFAALSVGQRFAIGRFILPAEAVVAFAAEFDPQFFHLDAEAAKFSIFGRHVASGLHTISATLGLAIRNGYLNRINLAGTALDGVRWTRPTPPDEPFDVSSVVEALTPRRGGRCTLQIRYDVADADGKDAATMVFSQILRAPGETERTA